MMNTMIILNRFKQISKYFQKNMINSYNNDENIIKLKRILLDRQMLPNKSVIIEHDNKPLILFDLNGTLTNNWKDRNERGELLLRPGINNLRRLK